MLTKGKQINKTKQNYGLDKGKTPDVSDIAAVYRLNDKLLYIHLARSGQFNIENGHRKKKRKK